MKQATAYLTIFQVFFAFISFGQVYHPLIKNNTFWDVVTIDDTQPNPCTYHNGFRYYFQGDTLIAGQLYHVLHAYSAVSINTMTPSYLFCPPFAADTSKKSIAGFLREDSIARKVYIYGVYYKGNHDTLLYDFSLKAGDTLKAYNSTCVIDSVGTTTLLNGASRKIFYINSQMSYTESIGGSMGIITPFNMPEFDWGQLWCVTQNNVRLWGDACFDQLTTGVNTVSKKDFLTVSPNPSQDFIQINHSTASLAIFNLFDLTGRIVASEKLSSTSEQIDIRQFAPGTYLYRCESNESGKVFGKIVVIR